MTKKFLIPYGALNKSENDTSPRSAASSVVEAALVQVRKDSRWRRGALAISLLFTFCYGLAIFFSGHDCSGSSVEVYDNPGTAESMYCRCASWVSSSVLSSAFDAPTRPVSEGTYGSSEVVVGGSGGVDEGRGKKTSIDRIVFGIGGNAGSWSERMEHVKLWWKPGVTRGYVWVDQNLTTSWKKGDPPFMVSEDTSQFSYTHAAKSRSPLRISRIAQESYRLGLPDVDWFVMGDDDTLFFTENLVKVLSKYDPRKKHYIGSYSECTSQSERHHYGLAFGGGGFAISWPLAKALSETQDDCLDRYAGLYGSDERVKACVSELGVPLTVEPGFHQLDLRGDISGFLAAHPVAPIVSVHHLDAVDPIFSGVNQLEGAKRLMKAAGVDSGGLFQQSICYDLEKQWSFSISWGYVVEIYEGFVPPRTLEMPARTFLSWVWGNQFQAFTFDTRALEGACDRPTRFFLSGAHTRESGESTVGSSSYAKLSEFEGKRCKAKREPVDTVQNILIENEPTPDHWYEGPQRRCCSVQHMDSRLIIFKVGACGESESLVPGRKKIVDTEKTTRRLLDSCN